MNDEELEVYFQKTAGEDPCPGREFVATLDPHPVETFGERCQRLIQAMKEHGFAADCPGVGPLSGILVPAKQAVPARAFLRTLQLDWLTGWISDAGEMQGFMFGFYDDKK